MINDRFNDQAKGKQCLWCIIPWSLDVSSLGTRVVAFWKRPLKIGYECVT